MFRPPLTPADGGKTIGLKTTITTVRTVVIKALTDLRSRFTLAGLVTGSKTLDTGSLGFRISLTSERFLNA